MGLSLQGAGVAPRTQPQGGEGPGTGNVWQRLTLPGGDVRVCGWGGGLRGGLEPWQWLPDVTGLSGNRLRAELPEAAAAAAARLGLWPLHSAPSAAATAAARRGLPPFSQLVAPGKGRGAAEGSRLLGGGARAGRTAPAACAGTPGYSFGPHPAQTRLARLVCAPQCNSLQLPLEHGKGALLCAAGLPGSGPREEPRARVGEARGKVRSPNFANENPDPSISSPLRKKQDTAECGAQGDGEKGAFAGMCFS